MSWNPCCLWLQRSPGSSIPGQPSGARLGRSPASGSDVSQGAVARKAPRRWAWAMATGPPGVCGGDWGSISAGEWTLRAQVRPGQSWAEMSLVLTAGQGYNIKTRHCLWMEAYWVLSCNPFHLGKRSNEVQIHNSFLLWKPTPISEEAPGILLWAFINVTNKAHFIFIWIGQWKCSTQNKHFMKF